MIDLVADDVGIPGLHQQRHEAALRALRRAPRSAASRPRNAGLPKSTKRSSPVSAGV